jgi:hypothetical protein
VSYVVGWVYEYPDGVEVVLQGRTAVEAGVAVRRGEVRSSAQRSSERSKRVLGRFVRHHQLHELWTLTIRPGDVLLSEEQAATNRALKEFFARFKRRVGESPGPYVLVEEFGKVNGWRHFHSGADWGRRFGAVEVCDVCALPALRRVRSDIPPAGSVCIGCLWGHGFVGRPFVREGAGLGPYLSKYLVSDVVGGGSLGANRYRVSAGFKPPAPEQIEASSFDDARRQITRAFGVPFDWWDSVEVERDMPRTVIGNWKGVKSDE